MPLDPEITGIYKSYNAGLASARADRELRLREQLARTGQLQQLREYDDRKAQEEAAATRNDNFNRLAALYMGQSHAPSLPAGFRNQFTASPTSQQPQGTAAPLNHFTESPMLGADASPSAPLQAAPAASAPRGGLNWGNLNRDELMREMILADPKRANEIRGWGDEQWRNEALQNYRRVEQILSSSTPKLLAERLAPDLVEGLVEDGHDWKSLTDDQVRNVSKAMMSELAPLAGVSMDTPLETVVGDNGKPVLLPRAQAAGREPYSKATGQPSSYEEFVLAQKDPEFAAFLKSRRGKGISITQPDGSVIQIGGEASEIGPGDLSGPTKNKLQEALVQASDELDRLNSIGQSFDPKFLTVQGKMLGAAMKLKDITGGLFGRMTPQEQDYLRRYSTFRADSGKNLSAIMNRLSGAAISPSEEVRLKKGIPTDEDSPTQFQAKYASAVKDVTRAMMRANWALKNGIGVRSVDQLAKVMPLDAIDQVYEQRANQIWQQLGGSPETKQQAIQQANQEFGLAR
jgi:hypothetical protein